MTFNPGHFGLKIDKLIPALVMMAVTWALIAFGLDNFSDWFDSNNHSMVSGFSSLPHHSGIHEASKMRWFEDSLLHHFGKTCEILIFLIVFKTFTNPETLLFTIPLFKVVSAAYNVLFNHGNSSSNFNSRLSDDKSKILFLCSLLTSK